MAEYLQTREELIEVAKRNYTRLFGEYDNPENALEVWFSYLSQIFEMDLISSARDVADESKTVRQLGDKLEILVSQPKSRFKRIAESAIGKKRSDEDAGEPVIRVRNRWYDSD